MQHAAVAQNLAEEVAKVADQLKDFELRAISADGFTQVQSQFCQRFVVPRTR